MGLYRLFRSKPIWRLGMFILIIGLITLAFQFFSLNSLQKETGGKKMKLKIKYEMLRRRTKVEEIQAKETKYKARLEKLKSNLQNQLNRKFEVVLKPSTTISLPHHIDKTKNKFVNIVEHSSTTRVTMVHRSSDVTLSRLRGVDPRKTHKYQKKDGTFTCHNEQEIIAFSMVNDDYCDCEDGSDEPGTSACKNSQFFCNYQPGGIYLSIPSSHVNDGLCDCCDGSDEFLSIPAPVEIYQKRFHDVIGNAKICNNTCHLIEKSKKEEIETHRQGIILKKKYIDLAYESLGDEHTREIYGPNGAFYKLSRQCYSIKGPSFLYNLCPFQKVTQQKFPQPEIVIGRTPVWISKEMSNYVLEMTGGDRHLCPESNSRKTLIIFICGLDDKVITLREDTRCIYKAEFLTPAAC